MFSCAQALVVKRPDGCVVLTGCAHSGLVNILKHMADRYGPVKAVIGGTHLVMGAPLAKIEATMDSLEEIGPEKIMVNHCTGSVVLSRTQDRFRERFIPGHAGAMLTL